MVGLLSCSYQVYLRLTLVSSSFQLASSTHPILTPTQISTITNVVDTQTALADNKTTIQQGNNVRTLTSSTRRLPLPLPFPSTVGTPFPFHLPPGHLPKSRTHHRWDVLAAASAHAVALRSYPDAAPVPPLKIDRTTALSSSPSARPTSPSSSSGLTSSAPVLRLHASAAPPGSSTATPSPRRQIQGCGEEASLPDTTSDGHRCPIEEEESRGDDGEVSSAMGTPAGRGDGRQWRRGERGGGPTGGGREEVLELAVGERAEEVVKLSTLPNSGRSRKPSSLPQSPPPRRRQAALAGRCL